MRTLADMTPQERSQCRGMWVTYQSPMGEHQAIYEAGSTLLEPGYGRFKIPLKNITPCYDLPRAWTPDGDPPAGEWEYAEYLGDYKGMSDVYYLDGDPTHRRWVGEWETVEEGEEA